MPLEHSSSNAALQRNMRTLHEDIGKSPHVQSRAQAIAIALETQRRARNRAGGGNVSAFQDEMGGMGGIGGMGGFLKRMQNTPLSQLFPAMIQGSPFSNMMSGVFPNQQNQISPQWQNHSNFQPIMQPPIENNSYRPSPAQSPIDSNYYKLPPQPPIGGSMGIAPFNPSAPSINQTQGTSGGGDLVNAMQGIARKVATGGGIENRAWGGFNMAKAPSLNPSYQSKMEMRNVAHTGAVLSNVPGRTDHHSTTVPSGSYVLPADHISSMGQGNTLAGVHILDKMFHQGPYGTSLPHLGHGRGIPRGPRLSTAHSGGGKGESDNVGSPVAVNVAGGEYVVTPQALQEFVHPDLGVAHQVMDRWVLQNRKKHISTLRGLPPPAKD